MIKLCEHCYRPMTGVGARVAVHLCEPTVRHQERRQGVIRPADEVVPARPALLDRADIPPDWS